jgi:uncharacterized membrane protein (UPF0136 family)
LFEDISRGAKILTNFFFYDIIKAQKAKKGNAFGKESTMIYYLIASIVVIISGIIGGIATFYEDFIDFPCGLICMVSVVIALVVIFVLSWFNSRANVDKPFKIFLLKNFLMLTLVLFLSQLFVGGIMGIYFEDIQVFLFGFCIAFLIFVLPVSIAVIIPAIIIYIIKKKNNIKA